MRSSRQGAIPSELGDLIDELDDVQRRLRILEAPSGESLGNTVAKLQALVANIQAQLDAWATNRWSNEQILAQIDAKIAAAFAGNVSITGSLTVGGAVTLPDVYNTDIASMGGSRQSVWVRNGGRMGHT